MSMPATHPGRRVALTGAFNVRDLGGYRGRVGSTVRWQVLYRADGLHRLDDDDLDRLSWLRLSTVVDLRTQRECEQRGRLATDRLTASYLHLPLIPRTWREEGHVPTDGDVDGFLVDRYLEMLERGAPALARLLERLADPDAYPLVFHCAAGKDRTGVVAAVILGLLGVDDETIAEDYRLSGEALPALRAWLARTAPELVDEMADQPEAYLAAPASAMRAFLAAVRDRHGSMVGYVRGIGVELETVEALHANLLD
jgi:protein-tyrosine phosphatase